METALGVKRSQPCERRGSFLLLLGRRKLLPAVEGRDAGVGDAGQGGGLLAAEKMRLC